MWTGFCQQFTVKIFKYTEKLKELNSEYPYIYHLSTVICIYYICFIICLIFWMHFRTGCMYLKDIFRSLFQLEVKGEGETEGDFEVLVLIFHRIKKEEEQVFMV